MSKSPKCQSSPHAAVLSKSPQERRFLVKKPPSGSQAHMPLPCQKAPKCQLSPHAPPRATQCLNSFPKGSRGANRTSAVPFLPLVAVPHKRTIDPRQPNPISGMEGEPCRVGSNRFPHDSRLVEWKLAGEEKLLCEARKSEHARRVSECCDWA